MKDVVPVTARPPCSDTPATTFSAPPTDKLPLTCADWPTHREPAVCNSQIVFKLPWIKVWPAILTEVVSWIESSLSWVSLILAPRSCNCPCLKRAKSINGPPEVLDSSWIFGFADPPTFNVPDILMEFAFIVVWTSMDVSTTRPPCSDVSPATLRVPQTAELPWSWVVPVTLKFSFTNALAWAHKAPPALKVVPARIAPPALIWPSTLTCPWELILLVLIFAWKLDSSATWRVPLTSRFPCKDVAPATLRVPPTDRLPVSPPFPQTSSPRAHNVPET